MLLNVYGMIIKGIPASHIEITAARRNKDYELEFINSESNNDIYKLKIFLRHADLDDKYKVRLVLISSILAYPALDMSWAFENSEYDLASRVYHRICDEVDDTKTDFDRSMAPITIVASKIREAAKPISINHHEATHILFLDEANKVQGVSDPRMSIYHGHYPKMSKAEKEKVHEFEGNDSESELKRKKYSLREKY